MTSYLQRLATRATGHTVTPSLLPPVRSEIRESESDPFAAASESHESPDAKSAQRAHGPQVTSGDDQVASMLHSRVRYSSESVELPAPVASATRSRLHKRSHAEETLEPAVVSTHAEATDFQRETASREIDAPATREREPRKTRDKTPARAKPAKAQRAGLDERNNLMPSSQGEARNTSERLTPGMEATVRSPASSRVMPSRVTDEPTRTLEPRRADAVRAAARVPGLIDEPAPTLEPRRADVISPAAPIPDEPRLVIGQLRVDVVAGAPAETREVVRVVTRTVGPGRSSNTGGPLSKLRFGLGQM